MEETQIRLSKIQSVDCLQFLHTATASTPPKKEVLIVVDNSKYIAYEELQLVKRGIVNMLSNPSSAAFIDAIITVADGTSLIQIGADTQTAIDRVNDIPHNAGSIGFNVAFALESIHSFVKSSAVNKSVITIMAGHDELNSLSNINKHMEAIYDVIYEHRDDADNTLNRVEFHTIGIGAQHDPYLLERLSLLGSSNGTYQYANERDIDAACERAWHIAHIEVVSAIVSTEQPSGDTRNFFLPMEKGVGSIFGEITPGDVYKFRCDDAIDEFVVPEPVPLSPLDETTATLCYILAEIRLFLPLFSSNLDADGFSRIADVMSNLRDVFDRTFVIARDVSNNGRRDIIIRCLQFKVLFDAIDTCVGKGLNSSFTIEDFKSLLHLYNRLKFPMLNTANGKESINVRALAEKTTECVKVGAALTIPEDIDVPWDARWRTLLQSGDCLCVYVDAQCRVYDEFVSAEDYLIDVLSGAPPSINRTRVYAMPLYICEENWQVAQMKLEPLVSILHANTPYNFTNELLAKYPFALFMNCVNRITDIRAGVVSKEFLTGARAHYTDAYKLCAAVIARAGDYTWFDNIKYIHSHITYPGNDASVSAIAHKEYLAIVAIATREGAIEMPPRDDYFNRLLDEHVRERLPAATPETVFEMMNVPEEYYQPHIDRYAAFMQTALDNELREGNTVWAQRGIKYMEGIGGDVANAPIDTPPNDKPSTIEAAVAADTSYADLKSIRTDTLAENLVDFITGVKVPYGIVDSIAAIAPYFKMMYGGEFKDSVRADVAVKAMLVQNLLQRHTRITAIKNNQFDEEYKPLHTNYTVPYTAETTKQYVDMSCGVVGSVSRAVDYFRGLIVELTLAHISQAKKECYEKINKQRLGFDCAPNVVFERSFNVNEVIGVLQSCTYGEDLGDLVRVLQYPQGPVPMIKTKLEILTTGRYNGKVIIDDTLDFIPSGRWTPSRAHLNKLWVRHRDVLSLNEFIELYPAHEALLQKKHALWQHETNCPDAV